MALYQVQKTDEAHSVKFSVMDWENRLLFAAAKVFPRGEKWLQREADAHFHPVLCVGMLGALSQFLLNAFITYYKDSFILLV